MIRRRFQSILYFLGILAIPSISFAQERTEKKLGLNELFELVEQNHPTLKVSQSDIAISTQNIEVAKNQLLPEIALGAQAYYLGDVNLLDTNFSNTMKVDMPHFGNKFSVEARQLIWKGGVVQNAIEIQNLRKDLTELSYEGNEQNIKLLTLGYYLDLFKLHNQEQVYVKNIELAKQRLENINK